MLLHPRSFFLSKGKLYQYTIYSQSVQFSCSVASDSVMLWTAAHQASLPITSSRNLLELMSIKSVMPSKCLILCRPPLLPSIFPSFRVFSNESVLPFRWPTPQFKSINSSALSFLYSPTLTPIHAYWKNQSFD